jgi:hypothetical protein
VRVEILSVDRGNGYGIDVTALGIGPAQVVPVEEGGASTINHYRFVIYGIRSKLMSFLVSVPNAISLDKHNNLFQNLYITFIVSTQPKVLVKVRLQLAVLQSS